MTTRLYIDAVGVVWMSGADRLDFLERLSTARLNNLSVGEGRATAVLTDIGRVVDVVGCYAANSGAILVTSAPGAAPALTEHLKSYIMFRDDVRITDATQQVSVLRLLGPGADGVVEAATGAAMGSVPASGWVELGDGEETTWVLRHLPRDRMNGLDVIVPRGAWADHMLEKLVDGGAVTSDGDAHTAARIEALLPAWGAEIDGTSNPLELGLKSIIDFEKGCYIGQEVVARLDTYDKVQRRLVRLQSSMPLRKGDLVREAREGADHTSDDRPEGREASDAGGSDAGGLDDPRRTTGAKPGRTGAGRRAGVITSAVRSGSTVPPGSDERPGAWWSALALVPMALDLSRGEVSVGEGAAATLTSVSEHPPLQRTTA